MTLRLAGLTAFFALVASTHATAGNHQLFQDPAGDNEGAGTGIYAADITDVEAISELTGKVTFRTTVLTSTADGGQLFTGDRISVWIDSDRNSATGVGGFEVALHAWGRTGQTPTFEFCRVDPELNIFDCQPGLPAGFFGTIEAPNKQTLNYSFRQAGWFHIRFLVESHYAHATGDRRDLAPNTGFWTFDVHADHDGDGISGYADKCPNRHAGRFDRDRDGCPGPYKKLRPAALRWDSFLRSSLGVAYRNLGVKDVPAKAKVVLRAGGRTFSRRGSGPIRGMNNRLLRAGSRMTITVTRPGFCTSYRILRIDPARATGFRAIAKGVRKPGGGIRCV